MGYLICDKCEGYYELKEGEAIDDFQSCACGGKLKYVKNLDKAILESDMLKKMSKCVYCGAENLNKDKFCGSCGKPLNINDNLDKSTKKVSGIIEANPNKTVEKENINILAIIFGLITAIVVYFLNFFSFIIIPALFSGIVAGYYASSDNYLKSISYGTFTSLIGISIGYVLLIFIFFRYYNFPTNSFYIGLILLQSIIFGCIGGYIGFYIKKVVT